MAIRAERGCRASRCLQRTLAEVARRPASRNRSGGPRVLPFMEILSFSRVSSSPRLRRFHRDALRPPSERHGARLRAPPEARGRGPLRERRSRRRHGRRQLHGPPRLGRGAGPQGDVLRDTGGILAPLRAACGRASRVGAGTRFPSRPARRGGRVQGAGAPEVEAPVPFATPVFAAKARRSAFTSAGFSIMTKCPASGISWISAEGFSVLTYAK